MLISAAMFAPAATVLTPAAAMFTPAAVTAVRAVPDTTGQAEDDNK